MDRDRYRNAARDSRGRDDRDGREREEYDSYGSNRGCHSERYEQRDSRERGVRNRADRELRY